MLQQMLVAQNKIQTERRRNFKFRQRFDKKVKNSTEVTQIQMSGFNLFLSPQFDISLIMTKDKRYIEFVLFDSAFSSHFVSINCCHYEKLLVHVRSRNYWIKYDKICKK